MLNEVYLMSSLPSLSFGQKPPISLEEFGDMARSELSARSFRVLEQVSMQGEDSDSPGARLKAVNKMMEGMLMDMAEIRDSRMEKRPAKA